MAARRASALSTHTETIRKTDLVDYSEPVAFLLLSIAGTRDLMMINSFDIVSNEKYASRVPNLSRGRKDHFRVPTAQESVLVEIMMLHPFSKYVAASIAIDVDETASTADARKN